MSLPTYYLVCFHEEATQEGVDFVAECLKKDVAEGGAELTIRQEDTTKNKWGGLIHGLLNRWTSHWLFRGAKNYGWGAGAWDPNYILGVDFLTMIFFNLKKFRLRSI